MDWGDAILSNSVVFIYQSMQFCPLCSQLSKLFPLFHPFAGGGASIPVTQDWWFTEMTLVVSQHLSGSFAAFLFTTVKFNEVHSIEQGHSLKIRVGKCQLAGGLSRPNHPLQAWTLAQLLFAVLYIFFPFEFQIQRFFGCLIRGSSFMLHSICRYIILKVLVMLNFNNHMLGLHLTI